MVTSRATVLSWPEGSTRTRSPGRTVPPTTRPEKPRKSWSGRFTHCTGIRKGPSLGACSISTVSRCSISVGPRYQGVCSLGVGDVVPPQSGERDADDVVDTELGGERPEVRRHTVEDLLGVPDQVELVDRQDHVTDAQERDEEGVPPGLGHHAGAGVDEDERQLGRGRAGDHVAGVLLMPRRVRHDELATFRREEPVGHIDGDPLLALGRQAVDQQCEVEVAPLGADLLRVRLRGPPGDPRRPVANRRAACR